MRRTPLLPYSLMCALVLPWSGVALSQDSAVEPDTTPAAESRPASSAEPSETAGVERGVAVGTPALIEPLATPEELAAIDSQLAELQEFLDDARFRTVVSVARATRSQLSALPPDTSVDERVASLEIMTATARIALGEVDQARANFARAIAAVPKLGLDDATTSPKVLAVFDAARQAFEARP